LSGGEAMLNIITLYDEQLRSTSIMAPDLNGTTR
jgi:hypothetical protein